MEKVFADAFFWIALANPGDHWYHAAKRFNEENPEISLVTTEEVLTEFLNYYSNSGERHRRIVGAMCQQVSVHPKIEVIEQSHQSFVRGLELYRMRDDKGYSLTDCISMSIMKEMGLQSVLTHDNHFTQEGFTTLL